MRVVQLAGVAASLATLGHAFLLPPTVSHHPKTKAISMPIALAETQVVDIPCLGCPVEGVDLAAVGNIRSLLRFNLSIAHNTFSDDFLLNDRQVWPYGGVNSIYLGPFSTDQFVLSRSGIWEYSGSPELQYHLSVFEPSRHDLDLSLIAVRLDIFSIGDSPVNGYPAISVKLLETPSKALMIGDVQVLPTKPTRLAAPGSKCTSMLCSWKAFFREKLSKLKGCSGGMRRPHHGQEAVESAHDDHHGVGHHRRPHYAHHHKPSGFVRVVRIVAWTFLIPAMVGIVIGAVIAGLIHAVVGIFVFFFCRRARRTLEDGVSDDEGDDENKSFIHHQEAPPVYEEAPVYQESVAIEKASE